MNSTESVDSLPGKSTKFEPVSKFEASEYEQSLGPEWIVIYDHGCDFDADEFVKVVHFLVRNPNVNSSNLFRADILYDSDGPEHVDAWLDSIPEALKAECPIVPTRLLDDGVQRRVIRRFIPRNEALDKPINQSVFYCRDDSETTAIRRVVVMVPHIKNSTMMPFYHPKVAGLAFVHTASPQSSKISISFCLFAEDVGQPFSNRQIRTAYHLLKTVWKHGQGNLTGYQKKVHHDQIIPQKRVQDRFADLKRKYAKRLISNWVEATDPAKQVFEQIGIAAFLMELWADMYQDKAFPGFVDIGCGNGVLMEILISEGYSGWGIEGHKRKTWPTLSQKTQRSLVHGVIVPAPLDWLDGRQLNEADFGISRNPLPECLNASVSVTKKLRSLSTKLFEREKTSKASTLPSFHNGLFNVSPETSEGPFLISNHADELTGWTPFLAFLNNSSFFAVPCCSRNLSGERFRAPSHGNNWTANLSAPRYFHAGRADKPEARKRHIAINLASNSGENGNDEDVQPVQNGRTASVSSSTSTVASMFASRRDAEQKYHFVNAAPLANLIDHAKSSTDNYRQTNSQAAETGDLKRLSQKARSKGLSGYQALCCWVVHLADKCGYLVEREMLRLPSTRNFGIVGRFMLGDLLLEDHPHEEINCRDLTFRRRVDKVLEIIKAEGGAERSKWVSVCEREVVKGNDIVEHGS